jgi:hypothetical protein
MYCSKYQLNIIKYKTRKYDWQKKMIWESEKFIKELQDILDKKKEYISPQDSMINMLCS